MSCLRGVGRLGAVEGGGGVMTGGGHSYTGPYRADAVSGSQRADKVALPLQHDVGTAWRSLQLGADSLADPGHVGLQHDGQEDCHIY